MDFDLNDDQRLLKESVGHILAARYGDFSRRPRLPGGAPKDSAGKSGPSTPMQEFSRCRSMPITGDSAADQSRR